MVPAVSPVHLAWMAHKAPLASKVYRDWMARRVNVVKQEQTALKDMRACLGYLAWLEIQAGKENVDCPARVDRQEKMASPVSEVGILI